MRWRRHETIEKSLRLLGFELDGQGVHSGANGLLSEEKRTLAVNDLIPLAEMIEQLFI
jgi:hypothetical protein